MVQRLIGRAGLGELDFEVGDVSAQGRGEILVEPSTMLIHRQSFDQTLEARVRTVGQRGSAERLIVRREQIRSWIEEE